MAAAAAPLYREKEVILSETEPFVHALKSRFKGEACDWCFARESYDYCDLQRCAKCKIQLYCSKECQTKDWFSGHKFECRYFRKPSFDFDDLCDGTQSKAEWARIMFRTVVKLKAQPKLKEAKYNCYNGKVTSFAELKYVPNRNKGVKNNAILPMSKAEAFKCFFLTTFGEDSFPLEVLWDIQSKLETHCFQISNPNGLFPMGVGLYMEATPFQRVSFNESSRANAEIQFTRNEIQAMANKEIAVGEEVFVLDSNALANMMGGNMVEMAFK